MKEGNKGKKYKQEGRGRRGDTVRTGDRDNKRSSLRTGKLK